MRMPTRTLIDSAKGVMKNTLQTFLKKAEPDQMPPLVMASVSVPFDCFAAFLKAALKHKDGSEISDEAASTIAGLMLIVSRRNNEILQFKGKNEVKDAFVDFIDSGYEKITGEKLDVDFTKVVVAAEEEVGREETAAPRPEPKKPGMH